MIVDTFTINGRLSFSEPLSLLMFMLGVMLVLIGFLILVVGILRHGGVKASETRIEGGGLLLIGPIPLIFGTNRGILIAMMIILIVLIVVFFIVPFILLVGW